MSFYSTKNENIATICHLTPFAHFVAIFDKDLPEDLIEVLLRKLTKRNTFLRGTFLGPEALKSRLIKGFLKKSFDIVFKAVLLLSIVLKRGKKTFKACLYEF